MGKPLGFIGVPSSMGAFAPGQEKTPAALRDADLLARMAAAGLTVIDHGDAPVRRWVPDRASPRAQNAAAVAAVGRETAGRVRGARELGHLPLVVGGDCTVGLGTVAGFLPSGERQALLYFDLHPDLNVPGSIQQGALDWMGVAHLLGEVGTVEEVANIGPVVPLFAPEQVLLFAWGPEQATPRERAAIERLGLRGIPVEEIAADPVAAATAALAALEPRADRLLLHFDVDVIDFTDAPLSEETGRNQGLAFDAAFAALRVLVGSRSLAAITITELNPDHGETGGATLDRFIRALVEALGAAPALHQRDA